MGDILVVGNTPVFRCLLVIGGEQDVHLIPVANVRAEEGSVEMRYTLVTEIAPCVIVSQVEAESEPFVGIHGKLGIEAVFAVLLVATVVVGDASIGRERIHEEEFVRLLEEETVRVGKDERTALPAVYEDTVLSGCIVVAEGIVFAVEACVERGVHEQMVHGIRGSGYDVAKLPVNRPGIVTFGYLFVLGGVVAVLVEIPVVVALGDVAVLVNLIEGTVVLGGRSEK